MSIECGECEHDLRGGHAENCSRNQNQSGENKPESKQSIDLLHLTEQDKSYENLITAAVKNRLTMPNRQTVEKIDEFTEHDWCWIYMMMSVWYENSYPVWRIQSFLVQFKWLSKNTRTQIVDLYTKAKR